MCIPYDRRRIGMAYGRSDFKVTETVYRQCQWCRCRHSRESTRPRELSRVSYQAGNFMGNLSRISERRRSCRGARPRAPPPTSRHSTLVDVFVALQGTAEEDNAHHTLTHTHQSPQRHKSTDHAVKPT